jgi:Mor family transcriptional regulator
VIYLNSRYGVGRSNLNDVPLEVDITAVDIFDSISGEYLDILQVTLMDIASQTHVPELYKIFGRENFLKFLDIFGGSTISVPSRDVLEGCMRDINIYLVMRKSGVDHQATLARDLAVKYQMSPGQVRSIFVKMEQKLQRYQLPKKT